MLFLSDILLRTLKTLTTLLLLIIQLDSIILFRESIKLEKMKKLYEVVTGKKRSHSHIKVTIWKETDSSYGCTVASSQVPWF